MCSEYPKYHAHKFTHVVQAVSIACVRLPLPPYATFYRLAWTFRGVPQSKCQKSAKGPTYHYEVEYPEIAKCRVNHDRKTKSKYVCVYIYIYSCMCLKSSLRF